MLIQHIVCEYMVLRLGDGDQEENTEEGKKQASNHAKLEIKQLENKSFHF